MGITMKRSLLSVTLASAVALTSANAADMYVPAAAGPGGFKDVPYVASWAGFYAGVNGGYGWSEHSDVLAGPGFRGLSPSGGFGGGQIGYNWQGVLDPRIVLGIEADIQGAGINDNKFFGPRPPILRVFSDFESRLDYFGTVRGRLGYAFGPS